ncbi:LysM peptidoglycan-binding domain-containing protein [Pradoshia sp.]
MVKKLLIFLGCCIVIYSVYYDLTYGTMPIATPAAVDKTNKTYYNIKVEPGDTVISLIEEKEGTLPVPIEQIIEDFRSLNNGLNPEEIKIGQTYRLKDY